MQPEIIADQRRQMVSGDSILIICEGENMPAVSAGDTKALCMGELYANLVKSSQGKISNHIAFCRRCGEEKIFPQDSTSHDRKA